MIFFCDTEGHESVLDQGVPPNSHLVNIMTLKVIQWGLGKVGKESLRGIISNPELKLVGVWKHSRAGTDVDAGEFCGLAPAGVRATNDKHSLIALDADCVVYMPRLSNLDEVCALLASGKNVICTPFLFYADCLPAPDRQKIHSACELGNTSLYGTGINPGVVGMVLPLAMTYMSRDIKRVSVYERANWSYYNNAKITFDNMRFGYPREEALLEANPFSRFNSEIFQQQIHMLAAAWDVELDDVITEQDLVVTGRSFDIISGHVAKGTVCGQRYHWQGIRDSELLIEIDALWNIGEAYPAHWPGPENGWTVAIEGTPSLKAHFHSRASLDPKSTASVEDHVHAADVATGMAAVNAIKGVCKAAAGVVTAKDLQPALPFKPFRRQ